MNKLKIKQNTRAVLILLLLTLAYLSPMLVGAAKLENPLAFKNIADFVAAALRALVQIALPVVGFFIVLSGFYFVSAGGNSDKIEKAKNNFFWVIAGSILILGAWVLSQLLAGTVDQLRA